jgi:hypothetical protein
MEDEEEVQVKHKKSKKKKSKTEGTQAWEDVSAVLSADQGFMDEETQ